MSGWNDDEWGSAPWGGPSAGPITLLNAVARRESTIRLVFSGVAYFSRILDVEDGSNPARYAVAGVAGTVGADGNAVRPVTVVAVERPESLAEVDATDAGMIVELQLDRPMTPLPAQYVVSVNGIFKEDLTSSIVSASFPLDAVFRQLQVPTIETARPVRDFGNPQVRSAMIDSLPDPDNPLNLGTIGVDDTGDYAFDEGLASLKKRILRRLVTSPGRFAHLPNYGVGIPDHGKRLATASVLSNLAAEAEKQIALEPDVSAVRVRPLTDPALPGLVRFQVFVRTKTGQGMKLDAPFSAA